MRRPNRSNFGNILTRKTFWEIGLRLFSFGSPHLVAFFFGAPVAFLPGGY
jgi:hypothetical protein